MYGGYGRGVGGGWRRRMGREVPGHNPWNSSPENNVGIPRTDSRWNDLAALKEQARAIEQELVSINNRIKELEERKQETTEAGSTPKAVVDQGQCVGCGICVGSCPVRAIDIDAQGIVTINENCTGCGLCVESCPRQAIRLEY